MKSHVTSTIPLHGSEGNSKSSMIGIDLLRHHLNRHLIGKPDVIELVLTCLLAQGHLLFEDVPGLGKTTLAKAIATGVRGSFSRVQCTPDLLPSDITGFNLFNQKTREFEFQEGPVFSDIVLTDEINRTPPRTQSALFEAMAERQVTIDGVSHSLNPSFFVIATQNPIESQGVFPLPDAQLDRFSMRLSIGYPEAADEVSLLRKHLQEGADLAQSDELRTPMSLEELQAIQQVVRRIEVHDRLLTYLVELANASRSFCAPEAGLSPRANIIWLRCAQAQAFLNHRDFVVPEDLHQVAFPVLSLRFSHVDTDSKKLIERILNHVAVPTV